MQIKQDHFAPDGLQFPDPLPLELVAEVERGDADGPGTAGVVAVLALVGGHVHQAGHVAGAPRLLAAAVAVG